MPTLTLTQPAPFRVYQRRDFVYRRAHANTALPSARGTGSVTIQATTDLAGVDALDVQVRGLGQAQPFAETYPAVACTRLGHVLEAEIQVPAGGWYLLHATARTSDGVADATTGPFGVGEVYVIAGQSYAANSNDALLTIDDPEGRVTAFDPFENRWRVAHDPQPVMDRSSGDHWELLARKVATGRIYTGGSMWPAAMNLLLPAIGVPIGLVNAAVGGTAIEEWLPGTPLNDGLKLAATAAGEIRAVLWQQGESNINTRTPTEEYRRMFREVKASLAAHTGRPTNWLVAKSTHHPSSYSLPEAEAALRDEVHAMWTDEPDVFPGPDTDQLGGPMRSRAGYGMHLTRAGQMAAGSLWFASLLAHLQASN